MSEPVMGTSGAGTVVLDLGAGIGALVLYTQAAMDGDEIEISRPGHARTHSRVRPRETSVGTRYAAVYPGLPAGQAGIASLVFPRFALSWESVSLGSGPSSALCKTRAPLCPARGRRHSIVSCRRRVRGDRRP